MKAEHVTSARFWRTPQDIVEIRVTVRFELLTEEEVSVSTKLSYEPLLFPDDWQVQDTLHQQLFHGVHSGLSSVERTLPANCLGFDIAQLQISPPVEGLNKEEIEGVGNLLLELVSGTVASLWSGSEALTNGSRSL